MRHAIPFGIVYLMLLPATPLRAQANAGPDQAICLDTTSMRANAPSSMDTAYWSLVSGNATIMDPSNPLTLVSNIDYGTHILAWTIITPVDTTTDQVSIIRFWADPSPANGGPDQTIYAPPFQATMNATPPIFPQTCSWTILSGPGIVNDPNDPYAVVSSLGIGENVLQWVCDDGACAVEFNGDQVVITVELSTSSGVGERGRGMGMWYDNATGLLRIAGELPISSLAIINAMGQGMVIRSGPSGGTIDVSDLPGGSYSATAIIGGERRTLRFVVSR